MQYLQEYSVILKVVVYSRTRVFNNLQEFYVVKTKKISDKMDQLILKFITITSHSESFDTKFGKTTAPISKILNSFLTCIAFLHEDQNKQGG